LTIMRRTLAPALCALALAPGASAGTLPTARYWLAAAVGGDGHIYAIGGTVDVSSQLPTVERLELLGALVAAAAPRPDPRPTETTP